MPDFFIVGHPKCGTTALYEMLRRHPQIFMPALKEPGSSPPTCARAFSAKPPARCRTRSRSTWRCSSRASPEAAGGGGLLFVSGVHCRGAQHRRAAARRAHHRDPARARQLPALAAPAAAAEPHRDRAVPARGACARARAASGPTDPAPLAAPAGAALLRARALRRAAAPLSRAVRGASRCWC